MSLILDALNRSRDSSEIIPTLSTQHPVEPVHESGRRYIPWVVLAVALVLIAWLLWSQLGEDPAPPETGSPVAELTENIGSAATSITTELKARAEARGTEAPPPALASPPATTQPAVAPPQPTSTQPAVAPPPASDDPAVAAIAEALSAPVQIESRKPVATAKAQVDPEPVGQPEQQDTATAENPAVARLYRDRSVPAEPARDVSTSSREEQPLDIEDVLKRAQDEMGQPAPDDHPVPFLSRLSQQAKNGIPSLYYQQHDYSNDASKSRVTLNGKTLRVGGSPAPGFKVEEILPNSVVLSYRGTEFRLRALNSWINL